MAIDSRQMERDLALGVNPITVSRVSDVSRATVADEFIDELSTLIGQNSIRQILRQKAEIGRHRGCVAHTLLLGPAGLGKTTLSRAFAINADSEFCELSCQSSDISCQAILDAITDMDNGGVLFLDEIHNLSGKDQEGLYTYLLEAKNPEGEELPRVTIFGATTHEGELLTAFLDRFPYKAYLAPYSVDELKLIVQREASLRDFVVNDDLALQIAKISLGRARRASALVGTLDEIRYLDDGNTFMRLVHWAGCDPFIGLDTQARRYLEKLHGIGKPVGRNTLATLMGVPEKTISHNIEPYLKDVVQWEIGGKVREGVLIETVSRGRILTALGKQYLKDCLAFEQLVAIMF